MLAHFSKILNNGNPKVIYDIHVCYKTGDIFICLLKGNVETSASFGFGSNPQIKDIFPNQKILLKSLPTYKKELYQYKKQIGYIQGSFDLEIVSQFRQELKLQQFRFYFMNEKIIL